MGKEESLAKVKNNNMLTTFTMELGTKLYATAADPCCPNHLFSSGMGCYLKGKKKN